MAYAWGTHGVLMAYSWRTPRAAVSAGTAVQVCAVNSYANVTDFGWYAPLLLSAAPTAAYSHLAQQLPLSPLPRCSRSAVSHL